MTLGNNSGRSMGPQEFIAQAKRRENQLVFGALFLAMIVGAMFSGFSGDEPLLPSVLFLAIAIPMLWYSPKTLFYVMFGSACLFELFPSSYADGTTDRVPFFWNVNTIFQTYFKVDFKAMPFNLFELLLLIAGLSALIQGIYTKSISIKWGPMYRPIGIYLGFVAWAWVNGMASGGDFKVSLQEVRSQLYFAIAYIIAVNVVKTARQINGLWWAMALTIGLKGAIYTYRRYVTLGGQPLPDQGVGSHEEAYFFVCFLLLLFCLSLVGNPEHRKLRTVMCLLTPLVILGDLATNRRAGTAALAIAIPILMLATYRSFPHRRRVLAITAIVIAIVGPLYYMAFKNSDAAWAQPARAIKSNFQPDERDANSNAYRDAENADQMATIRSSPILGYGYGKHFLHVVPIADISDDYEWWDLLPHNQVLWVWMRVGTLGFIAFWMMVATGLIYACQSARDETMSSDIRTLGLFCMSAFIALIFFGMLDLQLTNFRDMLMIGSWLGALGGRRLA